MLLNLLFHLVSSLTNKIVQDELTQLMGPINQLHNEACFSPAVQSWNLVRFSSVQSSEYENPVQ